MKILIKKIGKNLLDVLDKNKNKINKNTTNNFYSKNRINACIYQTANDGKGLKRRWNAEKMYKRII